MKTELDNIVQLIWLEYIDSHTLIKFSDAKNKQIDYSLVRQKYHWSKIALE